MSARQPWADELLAPPLRRASPQDRERVAQFLAAMDREGLYERHFAHGEAPNQALLRRLDLLDQRERVAILALAHDGAVLGHGEYVGEDGEAEFAIMLLPLLRGRGVGTRLLGALLESARNAGQTRLHGVIQATNTRALQLVLRNGFRIIPGDDATVVIVSRELEAALPAQTPGVAGHGYPDPANRHDFDRTSLYRRAEPGTPLRAGGG